MHFYLFIMFFYSLFSCQSSHTNKIKTQTLFPSILPAKQAAVSIPGPVPQLLSVIFAQKLCNNLVSSHLFQAAHHSWVIMQRRQYQLANYKQMNKEVNKSFMKCQHLHCFMPFVSVLSSACTCSPHDFSETWLH